MKIEVRNLNNEVVGSTELNSKIFGLPARKDIIARMVNYQLAKRRSGNHKAKSIGDISGTTKKPFNQKGTGKARQGSLRSAQMRGGACIFGPVVRSHAIDLTKKFRSLALRVALSIKAQEGKLKILNNFQLDESKTKVLTHKLNGLDIKSALFIDGSVVNTNFKRAAANLFNIDALPQQGINVYDILRRDTLILTQDALQHLEERFR